ncbi:Alpha/Beta hydrolase protein [Crepidotus variabilis]|uniref:Alpha/Beta hydrolase protein n=1 Tax=Crepidotus variabilis TaxID=179855 RepID=A0A9P6EIM1_9AGAR|nr:Alpha/Beta hydrolase protein [Crepidotus variabilis]
MASTTETPFIEEWVPGPRSTSFYTRTYLPSLTPKATIVFVHGFAEHIGRYAHFHPLLTSRGIAVFAYDQRGFGLTALDTKGHKSRDSSYGKTSWEEQMEDIEWAVGHAKKIREGIPLFLMGHSMGGEEVLGFGCRTKSTSVLSDLTAIIATSPLIQQTHPSPKLAKWVGGKLSALAPGFMVPAKVEATQLSHDPAVFKAYAEDPLVKMSGSLRGLNDMLTKADWLFATGHSEWKKDLPVLIIHGTDDQVTSCKASQTFHDSLPEGANKKIQLFEGGYHELHNEPDGVKEKLADRIIAYIEEQIAAGSSEAVARTSNSATSAKAVTTLDAQEPAAGVVVVGQSETPKPKI